MNFFNLISIFSILVSVVLAVFMFIKDKKSLPNIAFTLGMISIGLIEVADFMTLIKPAEIIYYKKFSLIGESLLPLLWLLFSLTFSRKYNEGITSFWKAMVILSVIPIPAIMVFPLDLFFYIHDIEENNIIYLNPLGYYFYLYVLIYSILTMINLEGTLRASSGNIRWQIKHMVIGIVGIMVSIIYYYSNALLYKSIDMNLTPVRNTLILVSSLMIMISILRQTFPKDGIYVSRRMLYRSITLFASGIYLLVLGLIGAGTRYLGGNFGRNLSVVILFSGAIVLIAATFSERLRRRVKVFIDKNFYEEKYDYRSQWIQFTQNISSAKSFEELLSLILEGFASLMGSKTKSLWLYNDKSDVYYQVKPQDLQTQSIILKSNSNLISYFREKGWVFNSMDGDKKILEENRDFFERTKAVLIVPLMNNGNIIGFISLGESLSNDIYNYEDYDILKTLARQASSVIMNTKLAEELAEAREMEAMGRVSSFILHDLKNLAYTLSVTAENAKENINDSAFQKDMLKTLLNTVEKTKALINKLSDMHKGIELNLEKVDLVSITKESIKPFLIGNNRIKFYGPDRLFIHLDRDEIKKVVTNLVLNAIEATNDGEVDVKISLDDKMACISVSDNGCGMTSEFIEKHLFKPFRTTKKKGLGIGLYQCKNIVEAHKGSIKVKSIEGKGTEFSVYLPMISEKN